MDLPAFEGRAFLRSGVIHVSRKNREGRSLEKFLHLWKFLHTVVSRFFGNFCRDHSFAYYELNTLGGIEMIETVVNHTDLSENAYKY